MADRYSHFFKYPARFLILFLFLFSVEFSADAQAQERKIEVDSSVTTQDQVTLMGKPSPILQQPEHNLSGMMMATPLPHYFMSITNGLM